MQKEELEREVAGLHAASFGWALSCCRRDRTEAEEVLQDVYVKILEGKARFDGRSSLKTWLFAVIRRTAAARGRRRMLHDLLLAKWARQQEPPVIDPPEHSDVAAILLDALQKLAMRQRQVLELVFYHDLTIEQASAALNMSIGSARVHYQRGKKQLLARLDGRIDR
ncbi:MAG TPA: RNA polymerase sigma factor [Thermoanaerobaculia bacterium]|nr:RNA polymerase sigma factor [Thermoanaerobaculia bacterium]